MSRLISNIRGFRAPTPRPIGKPRGPPVPASARQLVPAFARAAVVQPFCWRSLAVLFGNQALCGPLVLLCSFILLPRLASSLRGGLSLVRHAAC